MHGNRVPRVECERCGVKTAQVPWRRPESGFTLLFEAVIIMLCKTKTVKLVSELIGVYDTRLWQLSDVKRRMFVQSRT